MSTLLAVALSALLFGACTGLNDLWLAAWVAATPVLVAAYRPRARTAAVAAWAAYAGGSLGVARYLALVAPLPLVVVAVVGPAAVFAAAVLFARWAQQRLSVWAAVFAFPCAWTSYEFLSSLISVHGTSLNLAYSQVDVLPVLQLASVTGVWGISFLVSLTASCVASAATSRSARPLVPAAIAMAAVLVYGVVRLRQTDATPAVRVGLTATDAGVERAFRTKDPELAQRTVRGYAARVDRLAGAGARVVVLPEKFVGVTSEDGSQVRGILGEAARRGRVTVVAGLNRVGEKPPRNVAEVFAPDGRPVIEYDKRHMLPGPETGYLVGERPGLFDVDGGKWGVAICKDMDFPAWSRRYAALGVRVMAVPAWDFVRDGRLHARMAVVRAVENGVALVRTAQQGLLTVADARGRVKSEVSSAQEPEAMLLTDVTPGDGGTVYTRWGDWFGWAGVAGFAALAMARLVR